MSCQRPRKCTNHKPPSFATVAAATSSNPPLEDRLFDSARRSVRLWPVAGERSDELWDNAGIFLQEKLQLGPINEAQIEKIFRPENPSGAGVKMEVIVVFKLTEMRDKVMGASSKLSDCFNNEGRPTAGIRIEVLRHLRADFSALNKFGQQLRKRHGEGTRRHVKFDDIDKALFLNVKLPRDESWSRIPICVARKALKSREAKYSDALMKRMDISGSPCAEDRPRAASVSSLQSVAASKGKRMTWTGRGSIGSEMDLT